MLAILRSLLEWFSSLDWKSAWAVATGAVGCLYVFVEGLLKGLKTFEEWRGQKLTNQRQRLKLEALTASLTSSERQRIALELTGVELKQPDVERFRIHIEQWAKSKAVKELEDEIENLKERLEETEHELSEFQCPHCKAKLSVQEYGEGFSGEEHEYISYECLHAITDGQVSHYCEKDPDPPKIEDYNLKVMEIQEGTLKGYWVCNPEPRNQRGRKLWLERAISQTADGARNQLTERLKDITKRYRYTQPRG